MAPTIHLMRHAQGYHNLCVENEQLPDPDLTPLGLHQCAELRASFPYHGRVRRVISSPLRRTLHTSINVLGRDDLFPILPLEALQEVSISPCDTGSNIDVLRSEFGDKVDLQNLSPHWEDKSQTGPNQPDLLKLEERARRARQAIRELADPESDDHLVVVTHGDFLHFLTEDWDGVPELDCEYARCSGPGGPFVGILKFLFLFGCVCPECRLTTDSLCLEELRVPFIPVRERRGCGWELRAGRNGRKLEPTPRKRRAADDESAG